MAIHWYPGHMHKATREMTKILPEIDLVIELLDARLPASSQNPVIAALSQTKPCIKILSKSDLADPETTTAWQDHFEQDASVKTLQASPMAGRASYRAAIRCCCRTRTARSTRRTRSRRVSTTRGSDPSTLCCLQQAGCATSRPPTAKRLRRYRNARVSRAFFLHLRRRMHCTAPSAGPKKTPARRLFFACQVAATKICRPCSAPCSLAMRRRPRFMREPSHEASCTLEQRHPRRRRSR